MCFGVGSYAALKCRLNIYTSIYIYIYIYIYTEHFSADDQFKHLSRYFIYL